ncbi:unnamed protein product [Urochloa humidicola]
MVFSSPGDFCALPVADLRRLAGKFYLCSSSGFNKAADRRFVYLCNVSSGRRRRCDEDLCFFIISGDFTASAGDGCTRFVYQLVEKPGWVLFPTFFGGSSTPQGVSSSGVLGFMTSLEASESSQAGEVMAFSHLPFKPGRSAGTKQIGLDLLLKTASKIYASSPGWRSASSDELRSSAARRTGRILQGLDCNFLFFRRCLCKSLDVITKKSI